MGVNCTGCYAGLHCTVEHLRPVRKWSLEHVKQCCVLHDQTTVRAKPDNQLHAVHNDMSCLTRDPGTLASSHMP